MLTVQDITFKYPTSPINTLESIHFTVNSGRRLAIVGESGSGKTTLLKLMAGLLDPLEGTIRLDNKKILGPAFNLVPGNEYIRMVMQDYGLKKNFTIRENLIYQLRFLSAEEQDTIIQTLAKALSIESYLESPPQALSGGQQQRCAIACALAANPTVLLMDEPFSNLDILLTDKIKLFLTQSLQKNKNTLVFVTHYTPDALALADDIVVLRKGKIEQWGSTSEIYDQPASPYVAALFSDMNFFRWSKLHDIPMKGSATITAELGQHCIVGIRTDRVDVRTKGRARIKGTVIRTEFQGDRKKIFIRLDNKIQVKAYTSEWEVEKGTRVGVHFDREDLFFFPHHKNLDV